MKKILIFILALTVGSAIMAKEYHVAKTGNDNNKGTLESPFLTIQAAANLAQAGDFITVHEGVYREEITPPRGGSSDKQRITYKAAEGEKVEIKGSEVIENWIEESKGIWKVEVDNSLFGNFNPFADEVKGDWFDPKGRKHHTGCVYSKGKGLFEASSKKKVRQNGKNKPSWYAEVKLFYL